MLVLQSNGLKLLETINSTDSESEPTEISGMLVIVLKSLQVRVVVVKLNAMTVKTYAEVKQSI